MKVQAQPLVYALLAASLLAVACSRSSGDRPAPRAAVGNFLVGPTNQPVAPSANPINVQREFPVQGSVRFTDDFGLRNYSITLRPNFTTNPGDLVWNYTDNDTISGTNRLRNFTLSSTTLQRTGSYRLTISCTNINNQSSPLFTQDFNLQ
jgi:hypothetical protein